MYEYLDGTILKVGTSGAVLLVNGVGYGLDVPLTTLCNLREGERAALWVFTRVREDQIKLFGFETYEERRVFEILNQLNGVGPKVALAVMSTMSLGMLKNCVLARSVETLQMVPGIGKRTAEKMLVELDGKLDKFPAEVDASQEVIFEAKKLAFDDSLEGAASAQAVAREVRTDVESALSNLGFSGSDVRKVFVRLESELDPGSSLGFSELLRMALVSLKGGIQQKTSAKVKKSSPVKKMVVENTPKADHELF